jgi:hypothetical protein
MFTNKTITAFSNNQVAYPIGPNKDSYNHQAYFKQNVETGEINVTNEVIVNWPNDRTRKVLFSGTAKECEQFIINLVIEEEKKGKWMRNEKTWKEEYITNIECT